MKKQPIAKPRARLLKFFSNAWLAGLLVGMFMVPVVGWIALADAFTQLENAIARWLCAALFVFYLPHFPCAWFLTDSELRDIRIYLVFTGGIGFLAVSAGCLYDYFFPHFAQHRIYGDVPDYPGLRYAMGASLVVGFVMANIVIDELRYILRPKP